VVAPLGLRRGVLSFGAIGASAEDASDEVRGPCQSPRWLAPEHDDEGDGDQDVRQQSKDRHEDVPIA
jgi:hypothetical protein